ncbi:MAG TPA: hypothetical protein PLL20_07040 [Phycisphaerae bacterium]|nr:hypothetical protein [Phycisphaerae bacterium]HRR83466.1 hypothetical protein [Phycisphaerae bacterium]
MTREALGKVVACTALAVSWLAAVPRASEGQAPDIFPFGHESDSHVGLFAYYPDLVSWKNPDWWTNPDDAHMKPPIAQIFCDQLGERRGWIVFYVHEWKPTGGKFPTNSSDPRWIELQSALAFAYQHLRLIPILRLHWLDNTGNSVEGWPPDWDMVPRGQHWSVPVDTETYDSLRGANPEDPGYQDMALLMRTDYINWCTQLARSLRNECRWFIIGNELNHSAEYGGSPPYTEGGIVPPYWYASVWSGCFAGMARDENELGGPTKCQVLVAPLTPHSPSTAGQPWQDKLRDYAKAVDVAYRGKFGDVPDPDSLLPGFAIHGYPDGYESSSGDCEEHPIMNQFSQYISTIETTVHDDGSYPIAYAHDTEYIIDEYNSWTSADGDTTSYHEYSIRGILDHVSELRSTWAPNRLRAACYYAYRVPMIYIDGNPQGTFYDLVEPDGLWPHPTDITLRWKKTGFMRRYLNFAFDELVEYTGCTPPSEWCGSQLLVFPDGTPVVGEFNNVLDGDPETYVAARLDTSPDPDYWKGPYLRFALCPCDLEASYVVESISVKIYVDSEVTNASVWLSVGPNVLAGFQNVTLYDGCMFRTACPLTELYDQILVEVDCHESSGNTGLQNNIGVREIKIVNAPPPPITVSDIDVGDVGQTSASVSWTTEVASTSRVDYGTTTDYGSYTYDSAEVTDHAITLIGLSPGTTYYYKVTSTCDNYEDGIEFGQFTSMPAPPTIERSPATLSPSCTQGSNAASQSFTVRNSGGGTLSYSITDNMNWLSVTPTSGTSTGETDTITVNYTTSSLTPGTYNGAITITASGATNSPQTIPVTLTVTAPPPTITISNIYVDSITQTSARVCWTTNVASTSRVDYGTTTSYGSYAYDGTQVTGHAITLTGLSAATTYHFRVSSTRSGYRGGVSEDRTFTTAVGPIIITNIVATPQTFGAVISWTTNIPSTSLVEYRKAGAVGADGKWYKRGNEDLVTGHSITLAGLSSNTTYDYRVTSSAEGYETATSTIRQFTTLYCGPN